jgi:hypothetical protein
MSKLTPAPTTQKVTKAGLISILTAVGGFIAYFLAQNPQYGIVGAYIGYAIGDAVTFLQGNTVDNNWQYATIKVLLVGILSIAGTFIAQLLSANLIAPYIGGLIGYAIAEAVNVLQANPAVPPTQ